MSSERPPSAADRDMRMVAVVPERLTPALPPRPPSSAGGSNALVEYVPPGPNPEEEDLEIKLRRILEHVPVRVSNTSGSSAGSGSGDFHQYRQMRRKEQDRLARMDADYQKRKEVAEFNMRREERMKAAEEQSEKKRLKRLKKKQRKKEKKRKLNTGGEEHRKEESSEDDGDSDDDSRRISVHQSLGGGAVADVLLWRRWCGGVVLLVGSTSLWILFERAGYNLLSFAANVLLLLVAVLFFWGKSASLLNRPLPPLPDLEVSEESVLRAADEARVWINHALSVARDIAVEGNLKIFIQVALVLWIISYIGSFFNFLTLVYIGVLLSLSVPVLYEKYQDQIDEKLIVAHKIIQTQFRKIDDNILRKLPLPLNKEKKTQ
ncbi:Reticulon-like protein B11 [Camellia lanceoleosa]|uniref:Reticulon-like protein B11 n=1 Tax=Camellia lanceoleosa TaxID=1840588 RepID=A0ACC0FT42_9ERIC|nr:Reticulon-like protein B11 [Camellia lanceoleosa]